MSKLSEGISKLIDEEIKVVESKKAVLLNDVEALNKKITDDKSSAEKEIARKIAQCEADCRERINEANSLLKEAREKLATATQREADSLAINQLIKKLEEKTKSLKDDEKSFANIKSVTLEKEKKAELIIEQYNKKLAELSEIKNKK